METRIQQGTMQIDGRLQASVRERERERARVGG